VFQRRHDQTRYNSDDLKAGDNVATGHVKLIS
jgi:hypothetical protein